MEWGILGIPNISRCNVHVNYNNYWKLLFYSLHCIKLYKEYLMDLCESIVVDPFVWQQLILFWNLVHKLQILGGQTYIRQLFFSPIGKSKFNTRWWRNLRSYFKVSKRSLITSTLSPVNGSHHDIHSLTICFWLPTEYPIDENSFKKLFLYTVSTSPS